MSNNAAERTIRPLTLGRRHWTFLGSDTGSACAAVFFTILQSAKLNGINSEPYLTDIIGRIADHPAKKDRSAVAMELDAIGNVRVLTTRLRPKNNTYI